MVVILEKLKILKMTCQEPLHKFSSDLVGSKFIQMDHPRCPPLINVAKYETDKLRLSDRASLVFSYLRSCNFSFILSVLLYDTC